MDKVVRYEGEYDAVIQAGYGEHGREGLQELLAVPVIDITEAAASTAMYLGRSYSVVTTLDRTVPLIEDRLILAGLHDRCASVRSSGLGVLELESDPERAVEAIAAEAQRAVEVDRAEVIVLGCGGMAELKDRVVELCGVPVVDEFPPLDADELEEDMRELASFDSVMIVHAEDSRAIDRAPQPEGDDYGKFLASRPRGAENLAIAEVIERARWTGARAHILHLSSSDALPMLRTAKQDGLKLTVETCPHYLTLTAEEIPHGATQFKCCPPIREAGNRELLWQGLEDGTIDFIVSDHSPSTLDLKDLENGDFAVAWGGVASLQLGLSLIWTEARQRGLSLETVVGWMSERPAQFAGLTGKGRIAPGYDADFSVFAADDAYVVDVAKLHHKNPLTPYHGKALAGVVRKTWLHGEVVDFETPRGRLLRRGMTE
ncbi:allantoicase [Microbacterium sp. XT11]|nr:allantoicase [Microbacterium sp. XT11]